MGGLLRSSFQGTTRKADGVIGVGQALIAEFAERWGIGPERVEPFYRDLNVDCRLCSEAVKRCGTGVFDSDGIDRVAAEALARDLRVTLVNHPPAPHAFDVMDESEPTRELIRQMLGFLRARLLG